MGRHDNRTQITKELYLCTNLASYTRTLKKYLGRTEQAPHIVCIREDFRTYYFRRYVIIARHIFHWHQESVEDQLGRQVVVHELYIDLSCLVNWLGVPDPFIGIIYS